MNSRSFRQPFHIVDPEGAPSKDQLESVNRMEMARWVRFFEQLAEFCDYERKTERLCPICQSPFPEGKGLRGAVDRLSSCDHCFRRLLSFLNGTRPISIERYRTS